MKNGAAALLAGVIVVQFAAAEPVFEERTAEHIDLAGLPVADNSVKKLGLSDFDNDGAEDIVVARRSGDPLLLMNVAGVLVQQGFRFADPFAGSDAYDAAITDADGDGWPDIIFGRIGAVPSLYRNLGVDLDGNWLGFDSGSGIAAGAPSATMIEAADFDGDADPDLAMITATGNRRLLTNAGDATFTDTTATSLGDLVMVGMGQIQAGDVDADGDVDLFGVTGSETQQPIFLNDGSGHFPNSLVQQLALANLTYIPVGADFNGDGIFDFRVYADGFSPTAFMSQGTFSGPFPDYTLRFDPDMVGDNGKHGFAHIRDVDGDTDPDYIMSSIEMLGTGLSPDPRNELTEMVLTTGVYSGEFEVHADPEWRTEESYDVLFVDINLDGNLDLFIAHEGRYAAYINNADAQVVELTGFNPVLMQTGIPGTLSVNLSGGTDPDFSWSFGDGNVANSGSTPFVDHTYTAPGRYQVTVTVNDTAGTDQLSFWQIVHQPLVSGQAATAATILYETRIGGDRLWVVNTDNDSVTVIDAVSHSFIQQINAGDEPVSLARGAGNELWVVNKGDDTISVIDLVALNVAATLDILPRASRPHGIVRSSDRKYLYVALEAVGAVAKIDIATRQVLGTTTVGATPRQLAINADNSLLYVSRFVTAPVPGESTTSVSQLGGGEIWLVDTASMSVVNTIVLPYNDVEDTPDSARGIPNYVRGVALSPDGVTGVVPAIVSNVYRGLFRDGNSREHDRLVRSMLGRIDVTLQQETTTSRFDFDDQSQPAAAVFGPTGNHLFVVHEGSRALHVLDVYANQIIVAGIAGITPRGIALSPNGHTVFVHNYLDRSVMVYDATALMTGAANTLAQLATIDTVLVESLAPEVLQGKKLFFDAHDARLSSQAYISCTSCHDDAGHDGRTWDFADGGEGLRNTIDLRGRAGMAHGNVHWTANFDEIQDFENDIRHVFDGLGLMDDADFDATADTLGPPKSGLSAELDALAAYVATLNSVGQSPYRLADGTLTADAVAGRELFRNADCTACHSRVEFTDSPQALFHDIGTVDADTGGRLGEPLIDGGLDTPTLRGLWHGAPYLHDGSADTLQQAILAHSNQATVGVDVGLYTAQQLDQLAAYLLQIDDDEPWAPHPDGNYPPDAVNPGDQQSLLFEPVSLQVQAADLEGAPLAYDAGGLPDGLVIDTASGLIDGAATVAGDYAVSVSVSDDDGGVTQLDFGWVVVGDDDADGTLDHLDNCIAVANPAQADTDGDGFGNACDADFNNDCLVNFEDLTIMKTHFFSTDANTDLTGDGQVNFADLTVLRAVFFTSPGPSALAQCP